MARDFDGENIMAYNIDMRVNRSFLTEDINVENNFRNRDVIDETISLRIITLPQHYVMSHRKELYI
jgi:hypothetical protein